MINFSSAPLRSAVQVREHQHTATYSATFSDQTQVSGKYFLTCALKSAVFSSLKISLFVRAIMSFDSGTE